MSRVFHSANICAPRDDEDDEDDEDEEDNDDDDDDGARRCFTSL